MKENQISYLNLLIKQIKNRIYNLNEFDNLADLEEDLKEVEMQLAELRKGIR